MNLGPLGKLIKAVETPLVQPVTDSLAASLAKKFLTPAVIIAAAVGALLGFIGGIVVAGLFAH